MQELTQIILINEDKELPLHLAMNKKKKSIFKLLLAHGANPNISTRNQNSHLYIEPDNLEYLHLALENGLNVHTYYDGLQLLHMAFESGEIILKNKNILIKTIELLLKH